MHRAIPTANQYCFDKDHERAYRIHRRKLQEVKPSIDNKPPVTYPHLYQRLKKAQLEEDRCVRIEKDNRTLVARMTEIMQRPALGTFRTNDVLHYRSLNKNRRMKELVKITEENHSLLQRIQSTQPTYNHLHWEQDFERSEVLCGRICRYPYRPAARPASARSPMAQESPGSTARGMGMGVGAGAPDVFHQPAPPPPPQSTTDSQAPRSDSRADSKADTGGMQFDGVVQMTSSP